MHTITIKDIPGFEEWRRAARECLSQGISPDQIIWHSKDEHQDSLLNFDTHQPDNMRTTLYQISQQFIDLAETVICHANSDKYDLLYRVLWRLVHENKNLLKISTDADVMMITKYCKAVRQDAYKITAFLRFREIKMDDTEYFVAWYEPEHYSLELKLDFFKKRFKNMRWSILTPYRAAHWDMHDLTLEDNPDPSIYPADDKVEDYWLTYYSNIFNPARLKTKAMLNQMPKKYWKNMPEAKLIPDLISGSEARVKTMFRD